MVYLKVCQTTDEEARKRILEAIVRYQEYFPFSKYWDEITEKVGADIVVSTLVQTAEETGGRFIKFAIPDLKQGFEAFVKAGRLFEDFFNLLSSFQRIEKVERNEAFSKFLATCNELKNAYISYLALEDMVLFTTRRINKDDWWSKKEFEFLEGKKADSKLFFKRLKSLFPKYASINYVFTGMLMERLLWKITTSKRPPPLFKRNGFAVSL